jgi:hypothetical protein
MPRLKPPPARPEQESPEIVVAAPPVGEVEIELSADPSGETEVELHPSPTVQAEPKPEPVAEDNPLQKALDAQRHAEELQRATQRERDDARRLAREHEEELQRERGDREDAQYNSVLTAIAAEQSALDKAEGDYAAFAAAADWAAAGKAQRIMASASARLDRLEDGKLSFDSKREAAKTAPPERKPVPQRDAPLDFEQRIATLPTPAKDWLRKHPEFINDTALNEKIGNAHNYLVKNRGIEQFSGAYFDALDDEFGFKTAPQPEAKPAPQPQRRSMPMSAPVSRDVPTASGQRASPTKITLTEEERRIARTSYSAPDMTDAQKEFAYAKNKQKLQAMRANGQYRVTTEQNG